MAIKVIVFDFDGTLVDSNRLKYDAYFELFPQDEWHAQTVRKVLSEMFEESRFVILEEILRRLGDNAGMDLKQRSRELADRYNDIVLAGAKECPEKPGAHKLLQAFVKTYKLYVSSTTPESALTEIIHFRKWGHYFQGILGYPREKSKTLQNIIEQEKVESSEVLVVGDGESDRKSAVDNGCPFIHISENFHLKELTGLVAGL